MKRGTEEALDDQKPVKKAKANANETQSVNNCLYKHPVVPTTMTEEEASLLSQRETAVEQDRKQDVPSSDAKNSALLCTQTDYREDDPGILWLMEQYATGWRRYFPDISEMPKGWPGRASEDGGLRTEHLTDYWKSPLYKGPRDRFGILRNGFDREDPETKGDHVGNQGTH